MLIDHMGLLLFPELEILRYIGRLSFPIYAFMIAEGCKYTKNKIKYFLFVFTLAAVCQITFGIYSQSLYMSILVTFSLSILCIYALQYMKRTVTNEDEASSKKVASILIFFAAVIGTYVFCRIFEVDYGFLGCMVPVFASIFETEEELPKFLRGLGINPVRVLTMGIGLAVFIIFNGGFRYYAFLALPILLCYSGKRGKLKMKYFFYIFYPAHLLMLNLIATLI